MSAEDCQLKLIPDEIEEPKEGSTLSFKVPLDPDDPTSIKTVVRAKKMFDTSAEAVLSHVMHFDELSVQIGIGEGAPTYRLFERLLSPTILKTWNTIKKEILSSNADDEEEEETQEEEK